MEGLAAVVDGPGGGAVGFRDLVGHREAAPVDIENAVEIFVAHLVVHQHVFAEGGAGGRCDDGLPVVGGENLAGLHIIVERAGRFGHQRSEESAHHPLPRGAVIAEIVRPLGSGIAGNLDRVSDRFAWAGRGVGVESDLAAGTLHRVRQPVEMERGGTVVEAVGEVDADRFAQVGADHEWLDGVLAQPDGHLVRPGARFLGADFRDALVENIHEGLGVMIAETIEGHGDRDGRDVEDPVGGSGLAGRQSGSARALAQGGADCGERRDSRQSAHSQCEAPPGPARGGGRGGTPPTGNAHRPAQQKEKWNQQRLAHQCNSESLREKGAQ